LVSLEGNSGNAPKHVTIWDVLTGKPRASVAGKTYDLGPDGKLLATVSNSYDHTKAEIRDVATGQMLAVLDPGTLSLFDVVFNQDGSELLTLAGWAMQRWQVATGQRKSTFELDPSEGAAIAYAYFSPDQKTIITRHYDSAIRVWDIAGGKPIKELSGFKGNVMPLFFTHDQQFLIAYDIGDYLGAEHASEIRVWNVQTWRQTAFMQGHTDVVYSVRLSPDGTTLVSTSRDNTIRLWNMATGEEKKRFTALSPNAIFVGKRLISASGKTITIYGVPDSDHPALPYVFVPGHVVPSTVTVRAAPTVNSQGIGYALEGAVMVGGINAAKDYVYLPEYGGWARFDPKYVVVNHVDWLPTIAATPVK
jgi:WD40 repeat protein